MSFDGIESSKDSGSPYEMFLFNYGDQMPDRTEFRFQAGVPVDQAPTDGVTAMTYSPNGQLLVVLHGAVPKISIYLRKPDSGYEYWGTPEAVRARSAIQLPMPFGHAPVTRAAHPNPGPGNPDYPLLPKSVGTPISLAFSHDGAHLMVGSMNVPGHPNLHLYAVSYSAGAFDGLRYIAQPDVLPNRPVDPVGGVRCIAYSTNGQHVVVGHDGFPYVTFYERQGNVYVNYEGLAETAPGPVIDLSFKDDTHLVMTTATEAPVLYTRNGRNYTRTTTVPLTVGPGETFNKAQFTTDGDMLVVSRSRVPYLSNYKSTGDSFVSVANIVGGGPTAQIKALKFDNGSQRLLVAQEITPFLISYDIVGDLLVRTDEWEILGPAAPTAIAAGIINEDFVIGSAGVGAHLTVAHRKATVIPGSKGYYAYTNAVRPITMDLPGEEGIVVFEPIPIKRAAFGSNGKSEPTNLAIRFPVDADLSRLFLPYPPPRPVTVRIFHAHFDDSDREPVSVWVGKVLSSAREGNEALLTCDSSIVSMKRLGLRRNYQVGCPYVLYGSLCKASKDNASVTGVVSRIEDGAIVLNGNWFVGHDPTKFSGGMLSWQSEIGTEYRTMSKVSSGGAITYVGALRNIRVGTEVTLTLGCNHQKNDCKNVHNNILNFGGQSWIPIKNPTRYHPFW